MEAFAEYLLKSVIWLTGFALVYLLFLRNERFFVLNRLYLISGILSSFLLPFLTVRYTVILPVVREIQQESTFINGFQNVSIGNTPDTGFLLLILYLSGVLFVLTLIIKQSISVLKVIKKAEIITSYPVKLIRTTEYPASFSFFSYVFVNPSITDLETNEIVNHELVHIRQKHWFDLMLVELLCMLQWFNPLVWIYIRSIRQNHEYLADRVALQRTSEPAIYRAALLNQIVGSPVVSLANSFNYSRNKKRFNMMKNIISSPYRKMKIFLILPVFAIVLYSFAKPEYSYTYVDENSGTNSPVTNVQTKEVKGTVVHQQNNKPLEGAIVIVKGTTLGTSTNAKGYFRLENIPGEALLVVSYVGFKSKVIKPVFTSEMIIKMIRDTVKYLDANISTPLPPPPPPPPPPVNNSGNIDVPPPPPPMNDSGNIDVPTLFPSIFKNRGDGPTPLYVVDGVITDNINMLDPNTIESISVTKDKSAVALYGEKGKDGVIMISTKGNSPNEYDNKRSDFGFINHKTRDTIRMSANGSVQFKSDRKWPPPLYVVDGVIADNFNGNKIDPETIESITVYKDSTAINIYGVKGKFGVIEITTKKNDSSKNEKTESDVKSTGSAGNQKTDKDVFVVVEELPEFPGGGKALIPPYTITRKEGIMSTSFRKIKEEGSDVIIRFLVGGQIVDPWPIFINSSGHRYRLAQKVGFENVVFPFELTIGNYTPNTGQPRTEFECKINEPGKWEISISE